MFLNSYNAICAEYLPFAHPDPFPPSSASGACPIQTCCLVSSSLTIRHSAMRNLREGGEHSRPCWACCLLDQSYSLSQGSCPSSTLCLCIPEIVPSRHSFRPQGLNSPCCCQPWDTTLIFVVFQHLIHMFVNSLFINCFDYPNLEVPSVFSQDPDTDMKRKIQLQLINNY